MPRGGRGHGGFSRGRHFGSHHHGFHHHHHSSGRGSVGITSQASIDMLATNIMPPTLINGIYTFAGNQMSFRAQSTANPPQPMQDIMQQNLMMQNMMMQQNTVMQTDQNINGYNTMMPGMMGAQMMGMMPSIPTIDSQQMQQANITVIGSKTKPFNACCMISTLITGAFCILPLCFMCCMWWKKIAYAMYELTPEAYRDIGVFLERNPTVTNLNLTVADNSFNAEKAQILYESLSKSKLTGFTFINMALACNNQGNEADDFVANVMTLKSLSIPTNFKWGDMIA